MLRFILINEIYENDEGNLTHFMPLVSFCTPWKQKTWGFIMFSAGIERDGMKWVKSLKRQSHKIVKYTQKIRRQ